VAAPGRRQVILESVRDCVTAWTWLHELRSALHERPGMRLTGLVEADETYVGARNERGVRGRRLEGKRLVAAVVENRGKRAGALRLDGASTGRSTGRWWQRAPARAAEILPWSHVTFSNLKGWLRGTFHGVSRKHLPRYLQEFVYRTNRRWREHDLFFYVLRRAVQGEPLPWARLTAEATE
jgi:hypothetical protein